VRSPHGRARYTRAIGARNEIFEARREVSARVRGAARGVQVLAQIASGTGLKG